MEYRPLGRTGVQVSKLCLGTMMFGAWGNDDHDDSTRVIHAALDAGVNFVDTADVYSAGESEEIVGKALKDRRDDVVLATKFFMPMGEDPNRRGGSRRWIVRAVEDSLRRLGTDHIDLYQVHRPDPAVDVEETLGALTDLVQQGKVRYIGSSSYSGSEIVEAQWAARERGLERFRTEQPPYSLLTRSDRARRPAHRPAPRHGHPHLQPARRRLALRQLERRQLPDLPGAAAARRPLRHGAAREPAQARSRRAARQGRRRRRPDHDRAGDRVRRQPPGGHQRDHRPAHDGAAREPAARGGRDPRRGRPRPHRRDRQARRQPQPRRHQLRRAGPRAGTAGGAARPSPPRTPRGARRSASTGRRRGRPACPRTPRGRRRSRGPGRGR